MALSNGSWARLAMALVAVLSLSMSGCVGLLAQIGYVAGGDMTPAQYEGLAKKKVAVVVVSNGSTYGPGSEASLIGMGIEGFLRREVEDIKIINQDRIADWIDQHNWNEVDYIEIGKGLEADMVVAVDIEGYSLTDGPTMFKGSANYSVKVFDMSRKKGERVVWSKAPPTYEFPKHGGRYRDTTSKDKFKRQYNMMLSENIARYFYAYPFKNDYATDAIGLGD